MACPIGGPPYWAPLNLTEKFPGYRILDRNTPEYQMEAFMYTCVILLIYTVATGAFMVKFILQAREPWEPTDSDSSGAASALPMVVKLRERERHRKLVERQARRDVKMQMINHLRQLSSFSGITGRGESLERKTSIGSADTQITSFSLADQTSIGVMNSKERRPSISGASLLPHRSLIKSNSNTKYVTLIPLWQRRTFSDAWPPTPTSVHQPLTRLRSSLRYRHQQQSIDTIDDTLVSL